VEQGRREKENGRIMPGTEKGRRGERGDGESRRRE